MSQGGRADTGWTRRAAVALGGAAGTGLRLAVAEAVPLTKGAFPTATLLVNLVGAFLLGFALVRLLHAGRVRSASLLCTGLLGALTTFSTLAVEVVDLLGAAPLVAFAYVGVSLLLGPPAARAGLWLGERP